MAIKRSALVVLSLAYLESQGILEAMSPENICDYYRILNNGQFAAAVDLGFPGTHDEFDDMMICVQEGYVPKPFYDNGYVIDDREDKSKPEMSNFALANGFIDPETGISRF